MSVRMEFALVLGSELVRSTEVDPNDHALRHALEEPPIDGAWIVEIDEVEVLDENLWDRLDVVLLDLVKALRRLESGPGSASIVFPDTRASVRLQRREDGSLHMDYEGADAECEFAAFQAAASEMARRFADIVTAALGRVPATYLPLARLGKAAST